MSDSLPPPSGDPVSVSPPLSEEEQARQALAHNYMAVMYEAMKRRGQQAQQMRQKSEWLQIFLAFGPTTAQALCAAMAYMEQDLFEDEEANANAHNLFYYVAHQAVELLLPVLADRGLPSHPELWLEVHEHINDVVNQLLDGPDGDDE